MLTSNWIKKYTFGLDLNPKSKKKLFDVLHTFDTTNKAILDFSKRNTRTTK